MRVNAVIVAAGEGRRMGGAVRKPFVVIAGHPLIFHTLHRFAASRTVRKVIVVAAEEDLSRCQEVARAAPELRSLECAFQAGGPRRQDSVTEGLGRLDADCEVVVIHDGARPLASSLLIDRCVEAAFVEGAVVAGLPARNTMKFVSADRRVRETPPRESLWEIQTPQAFRVEIIIEAHQQAVREGGEVTDDATLVERLGKRVTVVDGERTNIKVTFPEDILLAETLLRTGQIG
ncbi:MAG: 2-C-methyl-D-erythritol 4-phosphate cytidylyltransferase [Deltaproteobacteria bacterium RIFCSPLOWO2_02_FULL_57_26]|nr:MAG: 2-C-methyl-D-erythritol 4-phosphate cytidylyltransferase [Deltaproteobacteria bacterium RIFCSPLOWO2_02_FULL_57_26]OGQ81795.1 MAG: 2-C-methyl-D-erythritol 4-phosphate cytidylyltransferase [Deltaproteobacteria bacterium RIFCSPLOWO2_12_FULL_57_22]